jgi:hypothetical protein
MISGYDLTFMTFRRRPAGSSGHLLMALVRNAAAPVRHNGPRRTTGREPA